MSEHRKYKIVLVDDAEDSLILFERFLEQEFKGVFDCTAFSVPKEALNYITQNHVDIVVSDLHMPEIDGTELLVKCKGMRKGIQFYVLTGDKNVSAALVSFMEGADGYILKPITSESVKFGMNQCLKHLDRWHEIFVNALKKSA